MARYYLIAGEPSGDMHAANLMKHVKVHDADASFRYWGGDRMMAEGGVLVKHIRDRSFMGFCEVVSNLRTILRNIKYCKQDILLHRPDALILIDYPGFNLRIADFAKSHGIPVIYYISPQVWAWKQSRVKKIKRVVDKLLVILPFEKAFYRRFNMDVTFPGHPLLDEVVPLRESVNHAAFRKENRLSGKPIVALLPGSRKQEISRMLTEMTTLAPHFNDYQFVVAAVSNQEGSLYNQFTRRENVSVVFDQTYSLLANARAALVASGTATLETALFGVPQAVCYKANPLSYFIARQLIRVKYISLVNLIMDKPVLKEMIQNNFSQQAMRDELDRLLHDETHRRKMKEAYRHLESMLGGPGASDNAARVVARFAGATKE